MESQYCPLHIATRKNIWQNDHRCLATSHTVTRGQHFNTDLAYYTNKICYHLQRYQSGTQAILSPCIVRTQHGKDCSQLTGNLISLTLPHSYPLNTSHPVDDDATGIFDMLHYNSREASLPSQCLTLDCNYNDVAISTL
jgi:hypothetical protein